MWCGTMRLRDIKLEADGTYTIYSFRLGNVSGDDYLRWVEDSARARAARLGVPRSKLCREIQVHPFHIVVRYYE